MTAVVVPEAVVLGLRAVAEAADDLLSVLRRQEPKNTEAEGWSLVRETYFQGLWELDLF